MRVVDLLFAIIWVGFWVYWFVAAAGSKAGKYRPGRFIGIRIGIILVVLLLFRVGVLRTQAASVTNPIPEAIGFVLFLLGLATAIWARMYLGRNWGMPMSTKVDPELVTTGPYRFVRHPIYLGIILAMIGTTVAVSVYWLAAVLLLGAYFIYSATVEERNMAGLFPNSYPAYKSSTKMLVPFIF